MVTHTNNIEIKLKLVLHVSKNSKPEQYIH